MNAVAERIDSTIRMDSPLAKAQAGHPLVSVQYRTQWAEWQDSIGELRESFATKSQEAFGFRPSFFTYSQWTPN